MIVVMVIVIAPITVKAGDSDLPEYPMPDGPDMSGEPHFDWGDWKFKMEPPVASPSADRFRIMQERYEREMHRAEAIALVWYADAGLRPMIQRPVRWIGLLRQDRYEQMLAIQRR